MIDKINKVLTIITAICVLAVAIWMLISYVDCIASIFISSKEKLMQHFWNFFVIVSNRT